MKKKKQFLKINLILSFLLLGILYFFSYLWINYFDENSSKFLRLNQEKSFYELKIVNLGSSHTKYGIKYPKDINGYNFALSAQTFYYDNKILKKYSNKLKENCIVIIPISIFSFYAGMDTENIDENYIFILEKKDILHLKNKEYFLLKYFSATQPLSRLYKTFFNIIDVLKNRNLNKFEVIYHNNFTLLEMKNDSIEAVERHLKNSSLENNYISIQQVIEILKFLEEKKYIPIFITTPTTYLFNEQMGIKNFEKRIYNNIKEVEKQMGKKYLYLDYSHDQRFEKNIEYFMDSDHLNENGAEYFTEILLEDIKNQGYHFD